MNPKYINKMNYAKIVDVIMDMISGFTDEQRNLLADKIKVKQKTMTLYFCKEIFNRGGNCWTIKSDPNKDDEDEYQFIEDYGEDSFTIDLKHDDKCYLYLFLIDCSYGSEIINVGTFDDDIIKMCKIEQQLFSEIKNFWDNGFYDKSENLLSIDDLRKNNGEKHIFTLFIKNDIISTGNLMNKDDELIVD